MNKLGVLLYFFIFKGKRKQIMCYFFSTHFYEILNELFKSIIYEIIKK